MFKKILIANRGEIACRVIRTARKMAIKTVAVYSESDRDAKHAADADESVCIGAPAAARSYLLADKIVDTCKQTGAEAVHPGYGFLSENTRFAELLEKENIVFIGPGAGAIQVMGDKIASKLLAEKSGVNVIPGHAEVIADGESAVKIAGEIGYPVMIKASAGGGGKGMRVAFNDEECADGFNRAASEAMSSFGDDRILIEKYIEQPRHIEIQIMADGHGSVIALNERECSIQRRHQKVIEEAPSPFLDKKTRRDMAEQAIALARAVDYRSAGTVEFIVDSARRFYFLEMNTRLQVEHPVTELITGLDLVELMIRVADGEKLPLTQKDVGIHGWAMESRIYAENPYRGFLPSTGRLKKYQPPEESDFVRVDTGVTEGSEISMFYDPMIAKLVTWGKTRKDAIDAMKRALDQYYIRGVDTNIPFVSAIMAHPRFAAGEISTDFIAREYADGFSQRTLPEALTGNLVAVLTTVHFRLARRAAAISGQVPGYGRNVSNEWTVIIGRSAHRADIGGDGGCWRVHFDGNEYLVEDDWLPTEAVFNGRVNGEPVSMHVEKNGFEYDVTWAGYFSRVMVMTPPAAALMAMMPVKRAASRSKFLLSPMPGLLVSLSVGEGQEVKAGTELAVIEAMKMENALRAEQDCTVARVLVQAGAVLEVDQPILEFE